MSIGENIKQFRKASGLSQREFARKISVTQATVCIWESDRIDPSLFNCIAMADYFGITLDELCGR